VFFLLPIVWLVLTSLKKEFEYMAYPITILPTTPMWDNYVQALTMAPFWRYFKNSVFLATTTATLTVASSALVGFGFARLKGPGKNILFSINIATLMIPWAVLGIPQFIVFSKIGLVNTYWPWVIWGLTGSPWHIFLFRQFFAAFPKELEDAAEVDGCGRLRTFVQIFLPNSLPVIAASFIFQFHWVWGDWVTPLLYLNDKLTTLSVILAGKAYVNPKAQVIVTITMAGVVLYMLPLIVVFFFAQRYIMEGVVTTGIKG
jgi:ABC-type glycerol-3-phosphate transport system permease component